VARSLKLAAALALALLAVSGAGGSPAQTPQRGGTVVVATNSLAEPACLGWLPVCDPLRRAQWLDKVLALPFAPGPRGMRNDLVQRYELAKDPFTITFHIRPRAHWSDGVPITARDFVFAYDTLLEHSGLPVDNPFRTAIRHVRAVNEKTVRFVFRAPYGDWRSLLNFHPLPRHALRGEKLAGEDLWRDRIDNPKTGKAIGSGPFLVGRWERGTQLTLVRNPRYWGRHAAYLGRIVLRFVRGVQTDEALRSGEFDLGVVAGTPSSELESDPRFTMLATPWGAWEHFEIRVGPGGHPGLRDKLVRRALAYGVDRVGLVRALFGAKASASPVLDNTIYLSSERSYEPNWNRYRYRPVEARRLLEQAGCSRGSDAIYSCAGERLRLRFVTTAGVSSREQILRVVTNQLERAGVEVETVYAPNVPLFDNVLPSGNFDVALFQYTKSVPGDAFSPYRCAATYSGYCSRLVDSDLDQLDRTLDPARRVVVANRIDRRLAADVPALPLLQYPLTYVVRRGRLHGVVPNGFSALTTGGSLWNAENWWLER
jgi:peptide/nickel transport system substrate-binding protein